MIQITDRDEKLLDTLAEYVSIYSEDAKKIYGEHAQYPVRRIGKLIEENYIIRNNKIVYLGFRGKDYLENKEIEVRSIPGEKEYKRRYAEIYRLFSQLSAFSFKTSWRLPRVTKNFAYKYYGQVSNKNSKSYIVYRLSPLKLKGTDEKQDEKTRNSKRLEISKIKSELSEIKSNKTTWGIEGELNVIIFVEDKETMDLLKIDPVSSNIVKEQILIPYTDSGIELVNKMVGEDEGNTISVIKKLKALNLKIVTEGVPSTVDFYIDTLPAYNLCTSDYSKEMWLKSRLEILNKNGKEISAIIVCTDKQKRKYAAEYPTCRIITVE